MANVKRPRPYSVLAGVGAGVGAALLMMLAMLGLRYFLGFPTVPELMLNKIVLLMGGEAFSAALDNLYYAGRPLLFTIMVEGTLLLGAILGLVYARLARPNPATGRRHPVFDSPLAGLAYGLLIGLLLNTVFLPLIDQPVFADRPFGVYSPTPLPVWAGLMLISLVFGLALHLLLPKPPAPVMALQADGSAVAPVTVSVSPQLQHATDRRYFLRIAGGTVLAVLGGVVFWLGGTRINQGLLTPTSGQSNVQPGEGDVAQNAEPQLPTAEPTLEPPVPTDTPEPPPTNTPEPVQAEATSTPGEVAQVPTDTPQPPPTDTPVPPEPTATPVPVPAIRVKEITPNESFYHVSKNFFDPSPSSNGWKLEIKGMVSNPYALTYEELTALKAITVTTGMMCISNPIGGGLIGSTNWKGVRMADLIKRAGPKNGVKEVVLRAVDDYSDSFAYEKALDPDVMVVWEMGGKPLNSQHGFPARVLVPGIYGMKHVKWLTSIELVDHDFKGYWQQPSQGWSDPAPVNTMSRIDFPTEGVLDLKTQSISGVAFAGDRSISKVEISADGGKSWEEAYVKKPLSSTSWVVWGYNWTPTKAGKYTLMVRATDGKGNVQTSKKADPYPNGATGYHSITYQVRAKAGRREVPDPESKVPSQDEATGIQQQGRKRIFMRGLGEPTGN
jgi:DMSO/TMAO reductase YedYZ molybdopterin-dependent catalytic subunit